MRSWQWVHGRRVQLTREGLVVDDRLIRSLPLPDGAPLDDLTTDALFVVLLPPDLAEEGTEGDVALVLYETMLSPPHMTLKDVREVFLDLGAVSGTVEINVSAAASQKLTATAPITLSSFVGVPAADQQSTFMLTLVNPGVGAITWPASVSFGDDTLPALPASGRARFAFTTDDGGTSWDGVLSFLKTD